MPADDEMQVEAVRKGLAEVLQLQARSVIQQTLVGSSLRGLDHQLVADRLTVFAQHELSDLGLLTEKLASVGGKAGSTVAAFDLPEDTSESLQGLIESEEETLKALHAVIPATGQEPRSEALEHLLEHVLQRKQEQVDWLRRVLGSS